MKMMFPCAQYAPEIAAYRQEFLDAGDSMDGTGILRRTADPVAWILACERLRSGEAPDGWVPCTQFMYVDEEQGRIVGMIDVRHRFNPYLEQYGGLIGYSVRPSQRKKGYAESMLKQALAYCWTDLQLDRVLITCLEGNEASRRTILHAGGVYECTVIEPTGHQRIERYWIEKQRI